MTQNLRTRLGAWWHEPPDGWLLEFLESRGALSWIKSGILSGSIALTFVPALLLFAPGGPHHAVARLLDWTIVIGGLLSAVWFARRPWPSQTESLWIMFWVDVTITVTIVLDSTPMLGLTRTAAFLWPGVYLTFFHGAKAQTAHAAWVMLITISLATVAGRAPGALGGWQASTAVAILSLTVTVGILPVLQLCFRMVRRGAADALVDPLTRVSNRRGLDLRLQRLSVQPSDQAMCIFAIDLDNFKTVNDRFGHSVGDSVLIQTADRIQAASGPGALIARVGGEEFVVIDILDPPMAGILAESLRRAISTTEPAVTASIGVAISGARPLPRGRELDAALTCADAAMYQAKRCGGDTVAIEMCVADAH